MSTDLGALKDEILEYLAAQGMIVFHSYLRHHEGVPTIGWDSKNYPDYQEFIHTAKRAGVEMMVVRCDHFSDGQVEEALADLKEAEFESRDKRRIERRLHELGGYAGFVSVLELSYDYQGRLYFFDVHTDWFDEYLDLQDEIAASLPEDEDLDDEGPVGGFYSRN
ncbi:MAG: hypothetical protein LLG20_19515 [Acidobacteriales bacterium]|nr:hypothetical protein [Terriglobales bacterium]